MNRRNFLGTVSSAATWAVVSLRSAASALKRVPYSAEETFRLALAEPLRHQHPVEIAADLARYRAHGYTGIWIENDYVRWTLAKDPDQGFDGCWRLFNIFDFTVSEARERYGAYLAEMSRLCAQQNLDIWASFWVPLPNAEMLRYLHEHRPRAIGRVTVNGKPLEVLCTCRAGEGLAFLGEMFDSFLKQFPQVKGVKIATEDNGARICDETCPNAHGTSKADHAGNLFGQIDRVVCQQQRHVQLMLYPWFWTDGFREQILAQLKSDYLVITKLEKNSRQTLSSEDEGDPLFDDSIVSATPGPDFRQWVARVGPDRIIDMMPVGSGVDDMFLNFPPYPGRVYRRLRLLRSCGVNRFLDCDCGGHNAGSNEEAVAVFAQDPLCSEATLLRRVSRRLYGSPSAQARAIDGWMKFDEGFGELPIGLGHSGIREFTGRFGFAWTMCIATPLAPAAFAAVDRKHEVFWFSPYNFFTFSNAPRLKRHLERVQQNWQASLISLEAADRAENSSTSRRECLAVQAHCLAVRSALNWCAAAALASTPSTADSAWIPVLENELNMTLEFLSLVDKHPWVWANNCWHPSQTVLRQKQIGFTSEDTDPLRAKVRLLNAAIHDRSHRQAS